MKLFPAETAVITTDMSPDEVSAALRENTHPGWSLFRRPAQLFMGHVNGRSFSLARVLREYQNSFVPQVTGEILTRGTGSKIEITMALLPFVKAFMRFWFGFLFALGPVFVAFGIFSPGLESKVFVIAPVVMFAIGYALTHGAFRFEVPRTKDALFRIVNGREEISEQPPGHVRK